MFEFRAFLHTFCVARIARPDGGFEQSENPGEEVGWTCFQISSLICVSSSPDRNICRPFENFTFSQSPAQGRHGMWSRDPLSQLSNRLSLMFRSTLRFHRFPRLSRLATRDLLMIIERFSQRLCRNTFRALEEVVQMSDAILNIRFPPNFHFLNIFAGFRRKVTRFLCLHCQHSDNHQYTPSIISSTKHQSINQSN